MADTVAHAKVVYTGDDTDFRRAARRVNRGVGDNIRAMRRLSLVAVAAAGSVALVGKNALSTAENINDAANKTRAGVDALQKLRFAADQNGASARDMDDALTRLTRRMSLFATDGGGPAAKALEALSINVKDASGNLRASDDVFREIVGKFESLKTNAEKAALASQLFGEDAGPRLLPLLNLGAKGIAEFSAKAEEMGLVLDVAMVRKGAEANAKIRALGNSLNTILTRAILDNSDTILRLASDISEIWIPAMINAGRGVKEFVAPIMAAIGALGALNRKIEEIAAATGAPILSPRGIMRDVDRIAGAFRKAPGYGEFANEFVEPGRGSTSAPAPRVPPVPDVEQLDLTAGDWLETYQKFLSEREKMTAGSAKKMSAIEAEENAKRVKSLGGFLDLMATKTTGAQGKMLRSLAAIAGKEGLINTYLGATQVLRDPSVPFWGKAAAVGSILASGMNLVNSIQSVSGVGAGGAGGAGASIPPQVTSAPANETFVNVSVVGDLFGPDVIRDFIGKINEAIEDGAIIKGVRVA